MNSVSGLSFFKEHSWGREPYSEPLLFANWFGNIYSSQDFRAANRLEGILKKIRPYVAHVEFEQENNQDAINPA